MSEQTMLLFKNNRYSVIGNSHTLRQLHERKINGDIVRSMVRKSYDKIAVQQTVAICARKIKLLVLRINANKYFIITCLDKTMRVKRTTVKIYLNI